MRASLLLFKRPSRRGALRAGLLATVAVAALVAISVRAQIPTSVNPLPEFGAPTRTPTVPAASAPVTPNPATSSPGAAAQVPAGENAENAIRILLEQASYWRSQYQPDRAGDSLTRVLALDRDNADALAMLAPIQAEMGQSQNAQDSLARLRRAHPNDPRIASVEQSLRAGELDQAQLAQARKLAAEGHASDAVKAYQRVFKGDTPPPGLAIEYYQTLGGSEGGFDQARNALARLVTQNPEDLRAQLAFAQIQTFRESTRLEGVKRLEVLVTKPAVAEQANKALHEALTWLPNDPTSVDSLEAYLKRNPSDADIKAKVAIARNPPGKSRQDAFEALDKNRLAEAETGFQNALSTDANDKDALGGLGLVRQRQGRIPEARDLLSRAAQIDPGWEAALGALNDAGRPGPGGGNGAVGGRGGDNGAGRAIAAQYARVNTLSGQGKNAQAEALLTKLMGRNGNWGNYLQLGNLQAAQGKLAEAETNLRRAMRLNPRNPAAAVSLAGVLDRENRGEESRQLLAQVGATSTGQAAGQVRALALRKQAEAETDPARRVALFQQAVDADPSFPWTKLELARALASQNQTPQAQQLMNGVISGPRPTKDQIQASIIFFQERGDMVGAARAIQFVPPKDRTPEMRQVEQQAALKTDIANALAGGDQAATRQRLLRVAASPDPTGARAAEVARRLIAMRDKVGAREAIRLGLASTPSPTAGQRLNYVGPLLDAGYKQDAAQLASAVDPSGLTPLQRQSFDGVRNGIAIQQSDTLNQQGKRAAAYDALAPRLADKPDSPDLNMALSRLYSADKKPEQAQRITDGLLQRDPSDLEVRHAAVDTALQAGDYARANSLIAEAEQQAPDDYRTQLMIADLARARGNTGRALSALRRARELRQQEVAGTTGG